MNGEEKELLARIDERVKGIDEKIERAFGSIKENRNRIERLERWKAYIVGIGITVGTVIGAIGGWFVKTWNGK